MHNPKCEMSKKYVPCGIYKIPTHKYYGDMFLQTVGNAEDLIMDRYEENQREKDSWNN